MENRHEFPEIEAMRMGVDYVGSISIRGYKLRIRPLSSHEYIQLAHEVNEDLQHLPDKSRTALMEHFLLAKKTLIKASTSDVGATDPKITDIMLNRMTMSEVIALYKEYSAFEERVNPVFEKMPLEELQRLVEHLKKSPSEATTLSFSQAVNVIRYFLTNGD